MSAERILDYLIKTMWIVKLHFIYNYINCIIQQWWVTFYFFFYPGKPQLLCSSILFLIHEKDLHSCDERRSWECGLHPWKICQTTLHFYILNKHIGSLTILIGSFNKREPQGRVEEPYAATNSPAPPPHAGRLLSRCRRMTSRSSTSSVASVGRFFF